MIKPLTISRFSPDTRLFVIYLTDKFDLNVYRSPIRPTRRQFIATLNFLRKNYFVR